MADIFEIAGRIHSTSQEHVISPADEILDTSQNKKQHLINSDVVRHESEINSPTNGLNKRVADIEALGQIGDTPVETNASNIINNTSLNGKVPSASAVNGVYNAVAANAGYYTCDSEASTAAKVVEASGYILTVGGCIKIKMTNANTADDDATLNINSTGAKALYYEGERASATNSWEEGETVEVYYDGTNLYANNVAGGSGSGDGAFDVSAKYPTSGVEGGNTYTLTSALAVLNTNLSARKKKGGMSIKFIQNYDNKYVQYRLMSDEFTTDTTQWAICGNDVYVESPEYVEVHTDYEDKVIYGVKNDGDFYFGAGIPSQIQGGLDTKVDKVDGKQLSTEDYTSIEKTKLSNLPTNTDLAVILNTKVDKVEGKSLIDAEYAAGKSVVENPEWIDVKTDSEDKILEGIRSDGTKVIELPVKVQDGKYLTVDNPEWIKVFTDNEDKIIHAINREGSAYYPVGLITSNLKTKDISFDEAEGSSLSLKNIHIGNSGLLAFQEDLIASGFGQKRILNYKKYRAIGDSLTNASNWINLVKDYLSIDSIVRSGSVGLCMADVPGTNSIHQAIMALTQDDELDLISIWAGTNDYNASIPLGDFDTQYNAAQRDTTTFYGAYMDSIEHLLSTFPHARLFLIGTTDRVSRAYNSSDPWDDARDGNLTKYVDATKKVAEQYSLPFLDLLRTSGINKYNIGQYMYLQTYPADNPTIELYLHFNDGFGMQSIAKRIASFINSIG